MGEIDNTHFAYRKRNASGLEAGGSSPLATVRVIADRTHIDIVLRVRFGAACKVERHNGNDAVGEDSRVACGENRAQGECIGSENHFPLGSRSLLPVDVRTRGSRIAGGYFLYLLAVGEVVHLDVVDIDAARLFCQRFGESDVLAFARIGIESDDALLVVHIRQAEECHRIKCGEVGRVGHHTYPDSIAYIGRTSRFGVELQLQLVQVFCHKRQGGMTRGNGRRRRSREIEIERILPAVCRRRIDIGVVRRRGSYSGVVPVDRLYGGERTICQAVLEVFDIRNVLSG